MHKLRRQFLHRGREQQIARPNSALMSTPVTLPPGATRRCKLEGGVSRSGANVEDAQASLEIERGRSSGSIAGWNARILSYALWRVRVDIDPVLLVVRARP